jgi:hypothetical protein
MRRREPSERLLYDRIETAELLGGISFATLYRLERAGKLRPVKLTDGPNSTIFYSAADVRALAAGTGACR